MKKVWAIVVLAALLIAGVVGAQNAPEDEADCIAGIWPEEPPASLVEVLLLTEVIKQACAGAVTMYAQSSANVRAAPSLTADKSGVLSWGEEVQAVCGLDGDEWRDSSEWCAVDGGYVHSALLGESKPVQSAAPVQVAPANEADVCTGYHHCIHLCATDAQAVGQKMVWAATGLNAGNHVKQQDNCRPLQGNERWFFDPCGGGGVYSEAWNDLGLWIRWQCP